MSAPAGRRRRLLFVVESGTDVRMVDGLAAIYDLELLCREIEGGVEISRPPTAAVTIAVGPGSRALFARRVWRTLLDRGAGFDAVLVQGYATAALAANLAGRLLGVPVTMLVCSPVEAYYRCRRSHPAPGKPYRAVEVAMLTALARWNARLGRRYVVLSDHLGQVVRGHGGRRREDGGPLIRRVPIYGVDLDVFRPLPEASAARCRRALRRRRNLPEEGEILFFSSRIAPEKDAETLLDACRLLADRGRRLTILHRSGGYREFAAAAAERGLAEQVIATDAVHPLDELPLDYRASDLVVQASREEGLGFSPLEALACGVPVVATAVGGLVETVRDGETGWSYPAGDVAALAAAIEEALDDWPEAARRTAAGRAMVEERFARRRVFAELEKLL